MIGTTAALIMGGLSAAGAIGSGVIGSRAAKGAAKTQATANQQAGVLGQQAADQSAAEVTAAGERAATGVTEAATRAGMGMWLSADDANALLRSIYGNAMDSLEPYTTTGKNAIQTLNAATGPGGDFNKTFTGADLESDPGYQFRLAEGQKALERSAAARGTSLGGGALKSLTRYSQGYASNEFENAFQRFRSDRSDRFGMLYNLAGVGLRATETGIGVGETYGGRAAGNIMRAGEYEGNVNTDAAARAGAFRLGSVGQAGQFRMTGAQIGGNALTGAADAHAAGQIGSANAWSSTLGQIGRTGMDLAYLAAPNRPAYQPTLPTVGARSPGETNLTATTTRNPNNIVYDPVTNTYKYV